MNHTSDQHPWFLSAKSSRDSPFRDFYYWRDPCREPESGPEPNNWRSVFGGSAWQWSEETGQYYLHQYAVEQPDCQWENPKVREAFYDIVRFWLERGCSGFRLDACSRLSKVEGLPDAEVVDPNQRYQNCNKLVKHGPRLCDYFRELYDQALKDYDLITVGEMSDTSPEMAMRYIDPDDPQLQMIFQFDYWALDSDNGNSLKYRRCPLPELKDCLNRWQTELDERGGWNSIVTSNHDQGRVVSKWGNDSPEWRTRSAQLLAILQATQPGTLYLYQGEELAMKNVPEDYRIEDLLDVQTIAYIRRIKTARAAESGEAEPDMSDIMRDLRIKARDNGRLPVPWDARQPHAGFTNCQQGPWMVANKNDSAYAAAQQEGDLDSVLSFWKRAIALRKAHNEYFIYGTFHLLDRDHPEVFAYTVAKTTDTDQVKAPSLVVLNFSESVTEWSLPANVEIGHVLLSNYTDAPERRNGRLILQGWQGVVYDAK
ncbi:hypothetical protein FFLO_01308 [Filobasidium floriforme]|uniref:Glycosyl hydrolase family 13 catalytic domain-containing protein n=1 Tax=Filobasidium floriforme TaxID=5210 RepID=A0A8K0JRN3_9TREE|nr:hypothetical protein FFLO_01308 [Filobasidium floriforme]